MATNDESRFNAEPPPPPERGWFSRNWLWAVPGGLLLLCLCPIGCCAGIVGGTMAGIRGSEPYETALARVQTDPAVIERLGEPIETGFFGTSGGVNVQNQSGTADLTFPVSGPNGQASVHTTATLTKGIWQTDTLTVTFDDGTQIDLLQESVE
jgi:hypothetical protein